MVVAPFTKGVVRALGSPGPHPPLLMDIRLTGLAIGPAAILPGFVLPEACDGEGLVAARAGFVFHACIISTFKELSSGDFMPD